MALVCTIIVAGCASTSTAPADPYAAVLGDWDMGTEFQGQTIEAVMTLSQVNGVLEGRWISQGREMVLMDVKLDGDRLTFRRDMGNVLVFEGTVDGDEITGVYTGPFGELKCTGRRAVDM
jgi:hypothetical protein